MAFILKINKFLISPKTIISLIILTLLACAIGFFVPQITDKSPSFFETWQGENIYTYRFVTRLQLHQVYTSYWFLALVCLIAISLSSSLSAQIKKNLKYRLKCGTQNTEHRIQNTDKIRNALHKKRYREQGFINEGYRLIFTKNSIGRWGGVIFHTGLLFVVISAILVLCFQNRGFVQLIEGDTFDGKESSFLVKSRGALSGEYNTGFNTFLSKLDHIYWETEELKHLASSLVIIKDKEPIKKTVSINNPLLIEGTNIYQSNDYGYTLSFVLKKLTGEKVVSHFNIDRASYVRKHAIGKSDYPMSPYIIEMKFLPDLEKKSFYLNKPIVYLNISEGLRKAFSGLVIPGDAVKIKDDILHFTGVRYWSGLIFVKNPGMSIAYIGFVIVIIGLVIMFLLPYKEIHLSFDPVQEVYNITGKTKKYEAIFNEELDEIRKEIES